MKQSIRINFENSKFRFMPSYYMWCNKSHHSYGKVSKKLHIQNYRGAMQRKICIWMKYRLDPCKKVVNTFMITGYRLQSIC